MTSRTLLQPEFRVRVNGFLHEMDSQDVRYTVTSTKRSFDEQKKLWLDYLAGRRKLPAAPPGTSKHETGTAIDIVFHPRPGGHGALSMADIESIADRWGLHRPLPTKDPVHWEPNSRFFKFLPPRALLDPVWDLFR